MPIIPKKRIKDFVSNTYWYHTIEFPDGLVSEGVYDHRSVLKYYGFPKSLKGKSVLDIGAADGFFSFEFEKRGAKSVLAIDTHKFDGSIGHTDISPAKINNYKKKYSRHQQEKELFKDICQFFRIKTPIKLLVAKSILSSAVEFQIDSIYNLSSWNKKFDFVFCGDLMEHLKNPLGALENLVAVTNEMCIICLSSCVKSMKKLPLLISFILLFEKILKKFGFHLIHKESKTLLEYHGNEAGGSFFHFYPKTFKQMALASGFRKVEIFSEFDLKNKKTGSYNHHVVFHCFV